MPRQTASAAEKLAFDAGPPWHPRKDFLPQIDEFPNNIRRTGATKMDKYTIILLVLGASWAGMSQIIKVVEIMNKRRDLVLGIDKRGKTLTISHRKLLLYSDFIPFWIGVMLFLAVFAGAFAALPTIVESKNHELHLLETVGCYGAAGLGGFAFLVVLIAGGTEIIRMRTYISEAATAQPFAN